MNWLVFFECIGAFVAALGYVWIVANLVVRWPWALWLFPVLTVLGFAFLAGMTTK